MFVDMSPTAIWYKIIRQFYEIHFDASNSWLFQYAQTPPPHSDTCTWIRMCVNCALRANYDVFTNLRHVQRPYILVAYDYCLPYAKVLGEKFTTRYPMHSVTRCELLALKVY